MLSKETEEKVAIMLTQIKNMEGLLGKDRTRSFTDKTLKHQIKKGNITEEQYHEIMRKLEYE